MIFFYKTEPSVCPNDISINDPSGLDLFHPEKKIYIELNNRYNTDNSSSRNENVRKLVQMRDLGFTVIYGVIKDPKPKKQKCPDGY
jgi:hypothetical protein